MPARTEVSTETLEGHHFKKDEAEVIIRTPRYWCQNHGTLTTRNHTHRRRLAVLQAAAWGWRETFWSPVTRRQLQVVFVKLDWGLTLIWSFFAWLPFFLGTEISNLCHSIQRWPWVLEETLDFGLLHSVRIVGNDRNSWSWSECILHLWVAHELTETRNRGNSLKFDIFDCQQDQNVLGDKSPGMVVGHFLGQINYGAQTHSKCEQHQSMCWAARLQKAEKG